LGCGGLDRPLMPKPSDGLHARSPHGKATPLTMRATNDAAANNDMPRM